MEDKYHKRLLDKLEKGLSRCNAFKIKTTINLDKHELEDLYLLWKNKVPQKVFDEIVKNHLIEEGKKNVEGSH